MKKYSLLAFLTLVVLLFTGCTAGDEDYTPAEKEAGAYLYTSASSYTFLPDDKQTFALNVGRSDASAAQDITVSCDNDGVTFNPNVSFAAGETSKAVPVTTDLQLGESVTLTFTLPSGAGFNYGDDTLKVTIKRDYNWVDAGYGSFTDAVFGLGPSTVYVQKAEGTSLYRFVQPYAVLCEDAGEEVLPTGGNIEFTFQNGTFTMEDGSYDLDESDEVIDYELYWDATRYGDYCNATVDGTTITVNALLLSGSSIYVMAPFFTFDWVDGFPE